MNKRVMVVIIIFLLILLISLTQITFFTIQPIGAIPEGVTLVIARGDRTKLFDSADGICLREMGVVSLFCRTIAITTILEETNILFRLPYIDFIYLKSTNGFRFEK